MFLNIENKRNDQIFSALKKEFKKVKIDACRSNVEKLEENLEMHELFNIVPPILLVEKSKRRKLNDRILDYSKLAGVEHARPRRGDHP